MCGIFACSPPVQDWLRSAIQHHHQRGPDQAAIVQTDWRDVRNIGIAINRLAITGLGDESAQPIRSRSQRSVCILNGAIYNFRELTEEFEINTGSENDGSIIVELYEHIGVEFVNYLRGMFTFVLVDLALGKIIVARDSLGIKPLYWAKGPDSRFAFSSTLKAIPDDLAVNTKSFNAGTVWVQTAEEERSFCITPRIKAETDLDAVLRKAVDLHIPTDVKWGASLSGGVDSSLVCALAGARATKFKCYSLYTGAGADFAASELVAKHLDLELHPVKFGKDDIIEALPVIVHTLGTFEEDMIIGGLGSYFTSKAAREHGSKVLLNGMGADEVFGGYPRYTRISPLAVRDQLIFDQAVIANKNCAHLELSSMAVSVESRVPFFDAEVVAAARRLPAEKLIDANHPWRTKIALREVALKYLPQSICARPKVAMGRGSGMHKLFADAIDEVGAKGVTQAEAQSYRLKNKAETVLYSIWKRSFGAVSASRADLFGRSLVNSLPCSGAI
jgi:asparagine synthase (glutamine-hydrolysing)